MICMCEWKLAVFDLDGVLTDTAKYHFLAWKMTLEDMGIPVTDEINELVKGVSRQDSLKIILDKANVPLDQNMFQRLLDKKNTLYLQLIKKLTEQDVLPGILNLLETLKNRDIVCVVASASKSAPLILQQLKINSFFKGIVNPAEIKNGKPAPDIFLKACEIAGISPQFGIGFEDARVGIQAIKAAGLKAVAIGDKGLLNESPDLYYQYSNQLEFDQINKLMEVPA